MLTLVVGLGLAAATLIAVRESAALSATSPAPPVQGTDVSSVQGSSINWADVAGSERFVAIKATEGD